MQKLLESSQDVIGNIVGGFLLLGFGTALALSSSKLHTFKCRRLNLPGDRGICKLCSQGILGSKCLSIPIESLQNAAIEESDCSVRVVILTKEGGFPLGQFYDGELGKKQNTVRKIRTFIGNANQESLSVEQDERGIGYFLGGFWGVPGVIQILISLINLLRRHT